MVGIEATNVMDLSKYMVVLLIKATKAVNWSKYTVNLAGESKFQTWGQRSPGFQTWWEQVM